MGFVAERLNNEEPIVIFTYEGKLTVEVFKEAIGANARFIQEIGEPIYIIADVRQLESTFLDMLQVMQEAAQDNEGSAKDENIKMLLFVGSGPFIRMYRETMQKRGSAFGMTIFETLELALEAVRIDISFKSQASAS